MDYLIVQTEEKLLTVAHFNLKRHAAELTAAATVALGDECSLAAAVSSIVGKITGSPRVILCISPLLVAQRLISLPFNDLRKVREVLPAHLQGEIAVPVEELAIEVMAAGDSRFLALWARKKSLREILALLSGAGLEPHIISSVPLALATYPGLPASCVVCDGTTLSLLDAGRLTYFRASDTLLSAAMISATLSALEFSGVAIPPLLCTIGRAEDISRDQLSLPVESVQAPAESGHLFKNEETFRQLAGLYAVARAAQDGTLPDFRKGELACTVLTAGLRRRLMASAVLAAIAISLLFAIKTIQYRTISTELTSVNKSITGIYREIFPNRTKAVDEISEVKGEIRKLAGLEAGESYLDVLKKLAEAKSTGITGLVEAELEGRTLRIKGDARSAQVVNEFKASLAPLLTVVELGEIKSRPDGTVTFSLSGTIKEVGK